MSEIPDRVYYRIGEVSRLVGVDPHVLRYWETEFKIIKPRRAKSKQRLYRRKDVENLLLIKNLLHDEGYTIAGARRLLKEPGRISHRTVRKKDSNTGCTDCLMIIKKELQELMKTISSLQS
jgi:DNA-binding transcriptional MerR regulator